MKAGRVQCRFDFMFPQYVSGKVLLEQVTWTYSPSLNKLPENYSSSIHCPLMNQLWATREHFFVRSTLAVFFHCPLMNNETALTHEEFSLHTCDGCSNAMPTWFRVPRAVDLNICLFDKQAIQESIITHPLSTHEPLMSHSWTTHEQFPQ